MTGYASISTAVNAIKMGATNYLPKPANVENILEAFNAEAAEVAESTESFEKPSLKRMTWEHIQYTLMRMTVIFPLPPEPWACTAAPYNACSISALLKSKNRANMACDTPATICRMFKGHKMTDNLP